MMLQEVGEDDHPNQLDCPYAAEFCGNVLEMHFSHAQRVLLCYHQSVCKYKECQRKLTRRSNVAFRISGMPLLFLLKRISLVSPLPYDFPFFLPWICLTRQINRIRKCPTISLFLFHLYATKAPMFNGQPQQKTYLVVILPVTAALFFLCSDLRMHMCISVHRGNTKQVMENP